MSEPERRRIDKIAKEGGVLYLLQNETLPDHWVKMNADKLSDYWFDFVVYHGASEFVIDHFGKEIENECMKLGFLKTPFTLKERRHILTMHKILRTAKKSLYKNDDIGYFENGGQRTGGLMPIHNQCIYFKKGGYTFYMKFNEINIATHIYCIAGDVTFPVNVFDISEENLINFFMMIKKMFADTFVQNTKLHDMIKKRTGIMTGGLYSNSQRDVITGSKMDEKIDKERKELFTVVSPILDNINDEIKKWQI